MFKKNPNSLVGSIPFPYIVKPDSKTAMIKKIKDKYVVLSETTGRAFGSYRTMAEAKKRLRQIEFFKYLKSKK